MRGGDGLFGRAGGLVALLVLPLYVGVLTQRITEARKRDPDLLEVLLELGVVEEEEADWVAAERSPTILTTTPNTTAAWRS